MVGKTPHVQVASRTTFQQEEERPIPVRSDDNACPRLAKPDLPMVPRRRIVRHFSLTHTRSPHLIYVVPPHKPDQPAYTPPLSARQTSPTRSTACCSARTRPDKHRTTYKSPRCRSPRVPDQAQTSSTAARTTTSAASWAGTRCPRARRASTSCRKSTIRARSTARATCRRTPI